MGGILTMIKPSLSCTDHYTIKGGLIITLLLLSSGLCSADSSNLITNGDFENGFSNWSVTGNHILIWTNNYYSPTHSVLSDWSASSPAYLSQSFDIPGSCDITLSFYSYCPQNMNSIVNIYHDSQIVYTNSIPDLQSYWMFDTNTFHVSEPGTYQLEFQLDTLVTNCLDSVNITYSNYTQEPDFISYYYSFNPNLEEDKLSNGLWFNWDRTNAINESAGLFINADAFETCDAGNATYPLVIDQVNRITGSWYDYYQGSANYTIQLRMHYSSGYTEIVDTATYLKANDSIPSGIYNSTLPIPFIDDGIDHHSGDKGDDAPNSIEVDGGDNNNNNYPNNNTFPEYNELNNPNSSGNLINNSTYSLNQSGGTPINNSIFLGYYQTVDTTFSAFNNPIQGILYFFCNPLYTLTDSINTLSSSMSNTFLSESGYTGFLYTIVHPFFTSIPDKVLQLMTYELLLSIILIVLRG